MKHHFIDMDNKSGLLVLVYLFRVVRLRKRRGVLSLNIDKIRAAAAVL